MNVGIIDLGPKFKRQFDALPKNIQSLTIKKGDIFRLNPMHPSLRLHALKGELEGLWSISLTQNYRIIFERQKNGDIVFISVGTHDIYKNL